MRIQTKAQRLEIRQSQFARMIEAGYSHEQYKELDFFTKIDGKYFTLKVFRGTSSTHEEYKNYRTEQDRATVIQQYKDNYERRTQWKAEQKEKNKGKSSSHAAAAAAIKAELKTAFPNIKFSVKSESFAGGDSVHVNWTDGPTEKEVEKYTRKYQYGHFDGMTDMYESTNRRDDIPQTKYVSESRTISDEITAILSADAERLFNPEIYNNVHTAQQFLYRVFCACSIPAGATVTGIEASGCTCGPSTTEAFYKIAYTTPETVAKQPEPEQQAEIEKKDGEVSIVDYSEKAFAVIGDTKSIKDLLYSLGGKFNARLTCGAGWIFSKKKLDEVTNALQSSGGNDTTATAGTSVLPTPETNTFDFGSFKILWHEGSQKPSFENTDFGSWDEVQRAFLTIWDANEKGQGGGYTKVKCEITIKGGETITTRIDVTDRINNGDFNPSQEHITDCLQRMFEDTEQEPEPQPQQYSSLAAIRGAAESGKVISLLNLSNVLGHVQQ